MSSNDSDGFLARIRAWINEGPKQVIAAVVAGALVFLLAWIGYGYLSGRSRGDDIMKEGRPVPVICHGCQFVGNAQVGWLEEFPVPCPQCGGKEAVVAAHCDRCRLSFPRASQPGAYYCPKCRQAFLSGR